MNQIIQIFRKDLRRFAFEAGLTALLLALYTWFEPRRWVPDWYMSMGFQFHEESSWLQWVIFLGWIILVIRVIQEESPAGDRQFWVTRPYEWPKLLAAKGLFLLAVVLLPLLLAQLILLGVAGFSPFHYFAGLLQLHLLLLSAGLLVMAVAVVTTGAGQMLRTMLLALLYFGGMVYLQPRFPDPSAWEGNWLWRWLELGLLISVSLAVIMRQYALRKTLNARLWLMAGALATIVLAFLIPYQRLIEREFTRMAPGEAPVFQVRLGAISYDPVTFDKKVQIHVPLLVGQLAPGHVAEVEGMQVSLEAPSGNEWSSRWRRWAQVVSGEMFAPAGAGQTSWVSVKPVFFMDEDIFNRLKDLPLKVHLSIGTGVFRDKENSLATETQGRFELPGVGVCVARGLLWCRAPVGTLTLAGITGPMFSSCPPTEADVQASRPDLTAWSSPARGGSDGMSLGPIDRFTPYVMRDGVNLTPLWWCPGIPLSFRQPELVRRVRIESEFSDVKLAAAKPGP